MEDGGSWGFLAELRDGAPDPSHKAILGVGEAKLGSQEGHLHELLCHPDEGQRLQAALPAAQIAMYLVRQSPLLASQPPLSVPAQDLVPVSVAQSA